MSPYSELVTQIKFKLLHEKKNQRQQKKTKQQCIVCTVFDSLIFSLSVIMTTVSGMSICLQGHYLTYHSDVTPSAINSMLLHFI